MKWEGSEESENVEDRRGMGPKLAIGGGASIIIVIVALVLGVDPRPLLNNAQNAAQQQQQQAPGEHKPRDKDKAAELTGVVLGYTEKVWTTEFKKMGKTYQKPHLVLFSDQVVTGCGTAPSAVGPFYCPADKKVYLDPTFFEELQNLGGSKADFSQAYVIAHEVGHHVQNLLGYSAQTDAMRGKPHEMEGSVRLELQADYLAGVWAHHAQKEFNFIEPGDVDAALKSANAIGDDKLQKRSGGFVHPEKYTHGTSAQRVKFFTEGLKTGDDSKARLDRFYTDSYNSKGELVE